MLKLPDEYALQWRVSVYWRSRCPRMVHLIRQPIRGIYCKGPVPVRVIFTIPSKALVSHPAIPT